MYLTGRDSGMFVYGVLLIAVAGLLSTACRPESPRQRNHLNTPVDTLAVRAAIDSLRKNYQQAVARGDYQTLNTFLTDEALIVNPGSAEWRAMRAESDLPFPKGATLEIEPSELVVLGPDWAYEMGTSSVTYVPANSETEVTLSETYLVLFRRTPDGWNVHREVSSSFIPGKLNGDK
ncbi:MAG: nuclear transport factor 2 family protein [Balneolaceae bacterium]|nr:nuclear transport factor 2 family protein [Balneolaceae bacterium]